MNTSGKRIHRDLQALEARRLHAGALFEKGSSPSQVATELGVSVQAACIWRDQWKEGGLSALRSSGPRGRRRKLSPEQIAELEKALLDGPTAHGYMTPLWTLERVREVIRRRFGVSYSESQVSRILRQMGWSRQKPARRAKERNEDLIAQWQKRDWPRIKKRP